MIFQNNIKAFKSILDQSYNQRLLTSKDGDNMEPTFRIDSKVQDNDSTSFYIFFNNDSGRVNRVILNTKDSLSDDEVNSVIEFLAEYVRELGQKVQL